MKSTLVLISLFVTCSACTSAPWNDDRKVDNKLVAAVPASDRDDIDDARNVRNKAADVVDVARRNTEIAKGQVRVAKKEESVTEAEMEKAEASVQMAEKGTAEELERARASLHEQKQIQKCARARISWRELDLERARAREELAEKKLVLAEARVELARAQAVRGLDRPEAKDVDVRDFEYTVRKHENAVAVAELGVDAVERETLIARERLDASVKIVPAGYRDRSSKLDEEVEYKDDGYKAQKSGKQAQKSKS